MKFRKVLTGVLLIASASIALSAPAAAQTPDAKEILQRYERFVVRVEYTLKYDRAQAPPSDRLRPMEGGRGAEHDEPDWAEIIHQERPAERSGYLVGPDLVVTEDIGLHPRFLRRIDVRAGDRLVKAEPAGAMLHSNAILLRLAEPLADEGLTFEGDAKRPSMYLRSLPVSGTWLTGVGRLDGSVWRTDEGWTVRSAPENALILDQQGLAVGAAYNRDLHEDGRWQGSPLDWPHLTQQELRERLEQLADLAPTLIPSVEMRLRSPRSDDVDASWGRFRAGFGDPDREMTRWQGPGVLLDEKAVLILAALRPSTTARLESVRVHLPNGDSIPARFRGSLRDYGALLVELDRPVDTKPRISSTPILDLRHELLLAMDLSIRDEHRIAYYQQERISRFGVGWQRQLYPALSAFGDRSGFARGYRFGQAVDASRNLRYLFDRDLALVAIPIGQRPKVTAEDEWTMEIARLTPAVYVASLLDEIERHLDPNNIPLAEDEQARVAWLGVELQRLDAELARMSDISDITNDGSFGAFITHIYDGSPAQRAGLRTGDVLLKIHVEGYPKPIEVHGTGTGRTFFPWEHYDDAPIEYILELPTPWPDAESRLTLSLTQVGFGVPIRLDYHRQGEILTADLTVEQSPPYYGNAVRYKNEALELTVRDLTYEVRRYFQRGPDDPGVIIARVEPGGKADIAGLRPYEIITRVNDAPIYSVDEFRAVLLGAEELRFEVRRMRRGRIVKILLDKPIADDRNLTDH